MALPHTQARRRPLAAAFLLLITTALTASGFLQPAHAALPDTNNPVLSLARTIRTSPFVGTSTSLKDNEGSGYVARDNSLWIVDDDGRTMDEVDPTTGALKRVIDRNQLAATKRLGGTATAGLDRGRDLESVAYDRATDTLYAFSGSCCTSTVLPTAYRLVRRNGVFQLDSFQPLPAGSDYTAADWNAADNKIYVGVSKNIRSYDYVTNTPGPIFQISGLTGILGFDFIDNGAKLLVARAPAQLSRVSWASKTIDPGWTFDLTGFGMLDARAAALVGDQIFMCDGYDHRAAGDPLSHAIFVFDVTASNTPPPAAPVASFTASTDAGPAPLSVAFTDTSTGSPTAWSWTFGDGQTSTVQNPTHVFTDPGTYTVRLTASNAGGQTSATRTITVSTGNPTPPGANLVANPGFEQGTASWDTNGATGVTLQRVSGGHSGSWAAQLTNSTGGTATMTLNDAPNTVTQSQAGTYTGSVWARADTPGAKLYLRVREYQGSTKVSEKVVGMTLSTSWQQVTATLAPTNPGSTSIEVATAVYSAAAGATYQADDVSLTYTP